MQIIFWTIIAVLVLIIFFLALRNSKVSEKNNFLNETLGKTSSELIEEREKIITLNSEASSLKEINKNLQEKLNEQKNELEELQKKFALEFENLANKIFEEKTNKFSEQSKNNLQEILNPLKEKINDFEKKVEESNKENIKGNASLREQLNMLKDLNQNISQEAKNLTQALKGQTKTQGRWGEVILDNILEKSGLVKGREYHAQEVIYENGRRFQPDILVNLPEGKSLIIDSKVSLLAYEKFCSSESDDERALSLKEHIASLRKHIKELSVKNYQNLYEIKSLDFVLLFMPIEPAFGLAVQNEDGLFNEAFEKNIVIVSPSTLLATLRTIASIWRQEKQNANALEIARQSGALYDKFCSLINDLIELGKKMNTAQSFYENSMKKLTSGRGNLISSVQSIKNLGAKATKSLPQSLINRLDDDETLF